MNRKNAFQLIISLGLVSLFADMVYESARSVSGPYLKLLSASAFQLGIIVGLGGLLGYVLRLLCGYLSDRTKTYWVFTFLGYFLIIFIPLLSIANLWYIAGLFIITERIGKAIRSPARDTIISQATQSIGTGFSFGLHEAMDQVGAVAGPLIFTLLFMFLGEQEKTIPDYQKGYALLWLPFILMVLFLILAYSRFRKVDVKKENITERKGLDRIFWLYSMFIFLTTLGFVNFILIGFHIKTNNIMGALFIPLLYSIAMGVDAITAVFIGKFYDKLKVRNKNSRSGLDSLIIIPFLSLCIPFLAFSKNDTLILISVVVWGIAMGLHETITRSAIADITPVAKRGTGYGIFYVIYGIGLFAGATLMGFLYDTSIPALIVITVAIQILSIILFFIMRKNWRSVPYTTNPALI